jgi:hypothetical protein
MICTVILHVLRASPRKRRVSARIGAASHLVSLCLFGAWFNAFCKHGVAPAVARVRGGVRGSLCIPWIWHADYTGPRTTEAIARALHASAACPTVAHEGQPMLVTAAGETPVTSEVSNKRPKHDHTIEE